MLKDIKIGANFEGTVKVLKRIELGPVIILMVTDGTKVVDAVIKRTDFKANDVIHIKGFVSERNDAARIEITSIVKSEESFDKIVEELSFVKERDFSVPSERFLKMKDKFYEIAVRIRKAVFNGQPILIRHHNDADGITSGLALEGAIKGLLGELGVDPKNFLYRSVCKAPFYETPDMLKDLGLSKRLENFGQSKPLVIVTDNGSTPEDVAALKAMKITGHDIIVIDHHNPVVLNDGVSAVCPYVQLHLNPYLYGMNGKTCCGMLNYEIARLVWDKFDNKILPAISSISDRCDIPETDEYIKNTGEDREFLKNLGTVIDYVSYNLRFDTAGDIYSEILVNKELVKTLLAEVRTGMKSQLQSTLPYVRTKEINGVVFSYIDLEKYTMRFTYPTPGRVIGAIHDTIAEEKGRGLPVLTIGYLSDMIIVRATQPVLPVATMIENLQKDIPSANVDGGGHECAGTLKFVSAHMGEVIEHIKGQLKTRKVTEE